MNDMIRSTIIFFVAISIGIWLEPYYGLMATGTAMITGLIILLHEFYKSEQNDHRR